MFTTITALTMTLSYGMCTFIGFGNNCATNLNICDADQCCVGTGFIGQCQRFRQQGEVCQTLPQRDSLNGNLYQDFCPCAPGLRCDSQGGIGIQLLGNCGLVPTTAVPMGVGNAVNNAAGTVTNAAGNAGTAANNTVMNAGSTVNDTLSNAGGAVQNFTNQG